jgi:uncharacterized membrane protein HdeD (DUF308 family)
MEKSSGFSQLEARIEEQYGLNRGLLFAVGVGCLVLGAISMVLPLYLYRSLIKFVGVLLLGSGLFKAVQLLLGRRSRAARTRSWPAIACEVVLDGAMGLLLTNQWRASVGVVTAVFGLLFVFEGLLLLYIALRSPSARSHRLLGICGLITVGIGLVILLRLVDDPLRWAGFFVGLKLVMFGATLTWIAARAHRSDRSLVYEAVMPEPVAGELYAVYFGTAFHLGVFIGDGEIVHYLNDNHVYHVTWEKFLEDRVPQHWTYPDLEPVPVEVVRATALSEVGKTYQYSLLKFNCEHFAIFCKSGGKTYCSKYAQIAGGVANVALHPFVGMVAELNTRLVEWLAFHFGGPAGKRLSLAIREFGATITNWLVNSRQLASTKQPDDQAASPG